MAILPLEVRPRKGERRNRRARWRVAAGPNGDQPQELVSATFYRNGGAHMQDAAPSEDAQVWQEVIWRLSDDVTVGQAINAATQRLEEANISTARLDAQVILAHVLGVDRSWLFAHHEQTLSPQQAEAYTELIVRRVMHEPVAYLTHRKEFYGIDLYVDRRVLIPRPETEMLVDQVLTEAAIRAPQEVIVADVGAGSGAISVAVAMNAENVRIYALDLSEDALAVARRNVETYALNERIQLLQSDLLTALPERADIVVANLPYVAEDDYWTLEPDVRDYEPAQALLGGPQGVAVIARLLPQLPGRCTPGALIVLEIGYNQGALLLEMVETLLPQATQLELHRDYQGRDRVISFLL
ncbi:MAG: peptide chain release factor N(5)-glutamine methyltransferase [Caldilinea sp.]|uniref:peptide chain release factor N(5)-glutamine methyltransferase n=1 Tax=Caldilinea sp. TaxID=2293560 RepID=UPI003099E3B8